MKTDRVYQIGEQVIRARAKKILHPTSPATQRLLRKMTRIMHSEHLVGIAAPQVGSSKRLFLTQPRSTKFRKRKSEGNLLVFINPRMMKSSGVSQTAYEGCGSVAQAGIFGKVARSKTIIIQAQDERGNSFTLQASGFLARIIQHEYDHLEGIVFLDRVKDTHSLLSRESYLRK